LQIIFSAKRVTCRKVSQQWSFRSTRDVEHVAGGELLAWRSDKLHFRENWRRIAGAEMITQSLERLTIDKATS
jgi:hypothetical protein